MDIDKIEKYPIAFVIKSEEDSEVLKERIRQGAIRQYSIKTIVDGYMASIEEIINIPVLIERFDIAIKQGHLADILGEILRQSKVEFNYDDNQ